MKILLINGSPKAEKSNSLMLARAFLDGLNESEVQIRHLAKMQIHSCMGCFSCWNKTPGYCVIHDDMQQILEDQLWADLIIWCFPLYYYSVPGILKNMIDRQLPMCLPFMSEKESTGSGSHDSRYDMSGKRHILISTCGFYSAEKNYDSVIQMFDNFLGKDRYETIFCGQGELFRVPEVKERIGQYLELVKQAGKEYALGCISEQTHKALAELLYPREIFEKWADLSWGLEKETGEPLDQSLVFTQQMAALYNTSGYDGKDRVLEICYTDLGKTYQIELTAEGSRVLEGSPLKMTTRIETPWDVWLRISRREVRGDAALAQGLYRVTGDFSLMIHWDVFFGREVVETRNPEEKKMKKRSRPYLVTLILVWVVFWVAISINPVIGGVITLVCCVLIPILMYGRMTIYDSISCGCVGLLSLVALLTQTSVFPVTVGYGCFGLIWVLSCFTKEPLCAAYVKYNYGGDEALQNVIFMKTNRILAMGWGVLYLLIALWSWFPLTLGYGILIQIINNSVTVLMGIFTVWFEHWYPSHVARG